MFEFKKTCDAFEKLSFAEKSLIIAEKSVKIITRLYAYAPREVEPSRALAGFIIGSAVADGKINEREYLLMYPSLVKIFGNEFDFTSVKERLSKNVDVKRAVADYTEQMIEILDCVDDGLKDEVIILCLCVTAIDGKISLREKKYIKRLYKS